MDSRRESSVTVDENVVVFSTTPRKVEDGIDEVVHVTEVEGAAKTRHSDHECHMNSDGEGGSVIVHNSASNDRSRKRAFPSICWGKKSDPGTEGTTGTLLGKAPKKAACPGLGLAYAMLSSVFFSFTGLLVKTIEGVHAVEVSVIRCIFQCVFILPAMIYYEVDFIGPREQRIYLLLRGVFGSTAMILLFYAVQHMPLADATVINFSNTVFTSVLAWIFLKERCTVWDLVFTAFSLTGVVLIARPPFLFGAQGPAYDGDYASHVKGTIAAFAGAVLVASNMVVLRKMGKGVHYFLTTWYYAIIGLIECLITLFCLDEWTLPFCGWDRCNLILIAVLGIGGQFFLTKALQIEKAGPVSLMRTLEIMLAFILQLVFLGRSPTWWSLGGALFVSTSTSGMALRMWYKTYRKGVRGGDHDNGTAPQ